MVYPVVNVYITMENHHFIAGKINYFDWAMFYVAFCMFTRPGRYLFGRRLKTYPKTPAFRICPLVFNIAMENGPFIDDFPIKTSIYKGFPWLCYITTWYMQ